MAIEERELGLEEEQTQEKEDAAAEARARAEAAEKKAQEEAIARARAEGELDALRRNQQSTQSQAPQGPTEAQWAEMENATGKTRQQIQADAALMHSLVERTTAPIKEELEKTKKEAAAARARAEKAEGTRSLDRIESEFYAKNPNFTARRTDIDDFLKKFPEESRNDPKKLAELLEDAKVYVRGKAKENLSSGKRTTEREETRTYERERRDEADLSDGPEERKVVLDFEDLEKPARRLIEDVHENYGHLDDRDEDEAKQVLAEVKKHSTGYGVAIDSSEEFVRGSRILRGSDKVGGSRGPR